MIEINCTNCDKPMKKWKSQIPKSGKAYCSLSCSTSYRNKHEYNPSKHRDLSGENNPMWGNGHLIAGEKNGMYGRTGESCPAFKGGRHIRKDGYYRVLVDGKRILEHRKVMLDEGHDLKDKIVHHKNRNRSDNRIENLEVMTREEHVEEHKLEMTEGKRRCM